jgi:type II secretory pathway component GspD/PulD (secretin)
MNSNRVAKGAINMKLISKIFAVNLAAVLACSLAWAQPAKPATDAATAKLATDAAPKRSACSYDSLIIKTFYLTNVVQQIDANELVTALRNMLDSCDKIFLVANQNAIFIQASPDQLALAQRLISDLDRPKKTYRLTYTVTEMDGDKRIGTQHYAMVVASGQPTVLKQGSRVPIATGSFGPGTSTQQTQFTYLDIGMNFESTLDEFVNGVRLRANVEQSSLAEEKSGVGPQDPVVRQTSLKGTSFLTPGKPLLLGSMDIPGSTRHLNVEVVMEQLP